MILQPFQDLSPSFKGGSMVLPITKARRNGGGIQFMLIGDCFFSPPVVLGGVWEPFPIYIEMSGRIEVRDPKGVVLCGVNLSMKADITVTLFPLQNYPDAEATFFSEIPYGGRPPLTVSRIGGTQVFEHIDTSTVDIARGFIRIYKTMKPPYVVEADSSIAVYAFSTVYTGLIPDDSTVHCSGGYIYGRVGERTTHVDSVVTIPETVGDSEMQCAVRLAEPPRAAFTETGFDADVAFDATNSKVSSGLPDPDPDLKIEDYEWKFGDGSAGQGVQVRHTYDEHGNYQVVLRVTDSYGGFNETLLTVPNEGFTRVGALVDESNVLTVAVRIGNLKIFRIDMSSKAKTELATFNNMRNPTLFRCGQKNEFANYYLFTQTIVPDQWALSYSRTKGSTWEGVGIVWGANYIGATILGTGEGVMVSAAIKNDGTTPIAYSKRSWDFGRTWEAETEVGEITGRKPIEIVQVEGGTRLVLLNGDGWTMISDDLGESWGGS